MTVTMQLAQSHWPRSGGDRANSAHLSITGPVNGSILHEIELPQSSFSPGSLSGCVVTDTISIRVVSSGYLSAVTFDGEIHWSIELKDLDRQSCEYWSQPLALNHGCCLVVVEDSICIYDEQGKCLIQHPLPEPLENSGYSPNLTKNGELLVTSVTGEIFLINLAEQANLGDFGYDLLPPAIYSDGSLAIAGYNGRGFCQMSAKGEIIWNSSFSEPDLLPCISQHNITAIGSLNDQQSAFYSFDGTCLGTYPRSSIFAEYSEDTWIARSKQYVAKITTTGKECWGVSLNDTINSWMLSQPIVDFLGHIYLLDDTNLICLNGQGETLFTIELNDRPNGELCAIAPGMLAIVCGDKLKIIG